MSKITEKTIIDAPVGEVWKAWDDYANIARFNPALKGSHLVDDNGETGIGATRQCDFADGKNHIRERIVEYVPEQRMVVSIYEGTVPLKTARAEIDMKPAGSNKTEVTFTLSFVPKMGLLGRLMAPIMKLQFRKAAAGILEGNRAYIERGVMANPT